MYDKKDVLPLVSHYLGNSCLLVHLCDQAHDLSEGVVRGDDRRPHPLHQFLPLGKAGGGLLQARREQRQ